MAEPTTTITGQGRTFTPRFSAAGDLAGLAVSEPHATTREVSRADVARLSAIKTPDHPEGDAPVFAEAAARLEGPKSAAATLKNDPPKF